MTQNADLTALKDARARRFRGVHWSEVVKFLGIVTVQWPPLLAAEGAMEPAARRDAELRALAQRAGAKPAARARDRRGLDGLHPGDG